MSRSYQALHSRGRWAAVVVLSLVGGWCVQAAGQPENEPPPPQASGVTGAEEIAALIAALGDRAYAKRDEAQRRLIAIGPPAIDALRTARGQESYEIRARAQRVLAILQSLFFAGVEVELKFSKASIVWDEPVDLTVKLTNRSRYDARVPFELDTSPRGDHDADDLHQLGLMFDVGEYLTVIGPQSREIDSRLDDVTSEAAAAKVIEARLDDGPVNVLRPGQSATVVLRTFNRGWARYPLLEAGTTVVKFLYQPGWPEDALYGELRDKRAWVVSGKEAEVTVTTGAPSVVSRSGREARLNLAREGDHWIARLTCTLDVPIRVNTNLGNGLPFAACHWVGDFGDTKLRVSAAPARPMSLSDFDRKRIVRVQPGEVVDIARIEVARLAETFAARGGDPDSKWTLQVDYLNLCNRTWQRRERAALAKQANVPDILREPLPRRMLVLHLISPTVIPSDLP